MIKKIIFSFLIGFTLGYIIMKFTYFKKIHHGPNSNIIKENIFYDENNYKCYHFVPKSYVCPLYLLKN